MHENDRQARRKGAATVLLVVFLLAAPPASWPSRPRRTGSSGRRLPGSSIIYIPSGKFLKYATFGYRALAADVIYLWAIQYYSTPTIDDRFDHLDHVFAIINELDPRYQDPYEVGALIAVDGARDVLSSARDISAGEAARSTPDRSSRPRSPSSTGARPTTPTSGSIPSTPGTSP